MAHLWINIEGTALEFLDSTPGSGELTYRDICHKMDERRTAEGSMQGTATDEEEKTGEGLRELGQDIRKLMQLA